MITYTPTAAAIARRNDIASFLDKRLVFPYYTYSNGSAVSVEGPGGEQAVITVSDTDCSVTITTEDTTVKISGHPLMICRVALTVLPAHCV